jgi:hypothetical protein
MMNFVTPQETVQRRNLVAQAQAQARALAQAQARRGPRAGQRGIAAPKVGQETEVVKFIVINKKK